MGTPEMFLENGPFTTYKKRPTVRPKKSRPDRCCRPRDTHKVDLSGLHRHDCNTKEPWTHWKSVRPVVPFLLTLYTLTCGAHGQIEIGKTNEIL